MVVRHLLVLLMVFGTELDATASQFEVCTDQKMQYAP
jgi:hypothetical protein